MATIYIFDGVTLQTSNSDSTLTRTYSHLGAQPAETHLLTTVTLPQLFPLCFLRPPFWIFWRVTAVHSFPDSRSPFPVPGISNIPFICNLSPTTAMHVLNYTFMGHNWTKLLFRRSNFIRASLPPFNFRYNFLQKKHDLNLIVFFFYELSYHFMPEQPLTCVITRITLWVNVSPMKLNFGKIVILLN